MKKVFLFSIFLFIFFKGFCQQLFCADSSIRIKYIFDNVGATLFNNPDTIGTNIFTGNFRFSGRQDEIAVLKTNWGDSIIWAKKIYTANGVSIFCYYNLTAIDGTIFCIGFINTINGSNFAICKLNSNGNVQWLKEYKTNQPIRPYYFGFIKNLAIANNSIYFTFQTINYSSVIAKLDLNGNIIWSKVFNVSSSLIGGFMSTPLYTNNQLYLLGYSYDNTNNVSRLQRNPIITKLSDADGSLINAIELKPFVNDPLIKGIEPRFLKYNNDNSFTLTGFVQVISSGQVLTSNIRTNTLVDINFNIIHNYYYTTNPFFDRYYDYNIDFNNKHEHAFLTTESLQQINKYFVTFDENDKVKRSRKFSYLSIGAVNNNSSINLDDKDNIHYLLHYPINNQLITDYTRISNFAPSGTLGCFGKDTSILTQYPFTLTKQPFIWDTITNNVLISNDIPYIEQDATVTKQVVCKIVSICDSVHINGLATACINQPLHYTITKNNSCFKNLDWAIDTAAANIISTEGDSAINIIFKKNYTGYIHAAITDCVVKDSFLVNISTASTIKITNKDSLLCHGKSITLNASPDFTNYIWQDGSTASSIAVNTAGWYKVSGINYCGNSSTDSIFVRYIDTSLTIPSSQTKCIYDTALITLPSNLNNITWLPNNYGLLRNSTLLLFPQQTTEYNIVTERFPNCLISKNTQVVVQPCPQAIFIPNSFTPNNDGLNDVFKPIISQPLIYYAFKIFNRYGQIVFETNNQQIGWDGLLNGSRQPIGGYIYQCSYQFLGTQVKTQKGYFILLR